MRDTQTRVSARASGPFDIGGELDRQPPRKGKIVHLGLSNVSVEQLSRARERTSIVSVQNRYNLADRADEDVLEGAGPASSLRGEPASSVRGRRAPRSAC